VGHDDASLAVLVERIAHERELWEAQLAAFDHERELRTLFDAHEREMRQQNEDSVEKARLAQFAVYETRLQNLNHAAERLEAMAKTFLTIDRFEREHSNLIDRYEREREVLGTKLAEQESVTVRQDAQSDLLRQSQQNQRWLIGLAASSGLAVIALLLHLFGAY
jgi:hypothetical protein